MTDSVAHKFKHHTFADPNYRYRMQFTSGSYHFMSMLYYAFDMNEAVEVLSVLRHELIEELK